MKAMLAVALATILISSKPSHAFDPAIKDAVYNLEVNVRVRLLYTLVMEEKTQSFYGTGFVVSKDGHLFTCQHVADPRDIVEHVINNQMRPGYTADEADVYLHYRIQNQAGDAYTTDFKPITKIVKCDHNAVTVSISEMESRPGYDESKRQLRILGRDDKDLMQVKLESGKPLAYINLTQSGPPSTQIDKCKDLLYGLSARETSDGIFVARRLGLPADPNPSDQFPELFQILMTTVPGDSGSPVVTEGGVLIGMLQSHDSPMQADTSYALQAAYLENFHEKSLRQQSAYRQDQCQPATKKFRPLARFFN